MQPRKLLFAVFVMPAVVAIATPAASRNPALFSGEAGFHGARFDRVSIGVEAKDWLSSAIRYWNNRAGWELFVFDPSPQVTAGYVKDCPNCAWAYPDWPQPYVRCEVSVAPSARDEVTTVAHELGHCLGLRHQPKGVMSSRVPGRIPQRWKTFDRKLLVEAGYAE